MTAAAVSTLTSLPLRHLRRGKVREVYEVDAERLLIVATDRVSAFDVVMNEPVPHKGAVLTQLTAWWLRRLAEDPSPVIPSPSPVIPSEARNLQFGAGSARNLQFGAGVRHHMLASDIDEITSTLPALTPHRDELAGRSMLCLRTEVFPVECVVRGYISGSAWKEYRERGTLAGEKLAPGLRESSRFDKPIFSPATKAEEGHDENITRAQMARILGASVAQELERLSLHVYGLGRDIAEQRGIIIADTKFEFGRDREGRTTLIDEVMTPDSSRFWPADKYQPGRTQPSFDKQPLRDYLDRERQAGRWNGEHPPPALPADVVKATSTRYLDAFRRITGRDLSDVVVQ